MITGIRVDKISDHSMFVIWSGPTMEYIVDAWTPNGQNITYRSKIVNLAPFTELNSTKPYYVSIRPAPDSPDGLPKCPPKEVMAGMFYVHEKGILNNFKTIILEFLLLLLPNTPFSFFFITQNESLLSMGKQKLLDQELSLHRGPR